MPLFCLFLNSTGKIDIRKPSSNILRVTVGTLQKLVVLGAENNILTIPPPPHARENVLWHLLAPNQFLAHISRTLRRREEILAPNFSL